jgi:hypothetical protein
MQQFLKPAGGAARARIIPTEFLDQFLVAVNNAHSALHLRLGWEPSTALAGALEKRARSLIGNLPYDLLG